ncbi:MAG: DUF411 domain-containing protein [Gemmatimonadales bacterium]
MRATSLLIIGAVLATSTAAVPAVRPAPAPLTITVYHSPTCGCCKKWVEYLRAEGFTVKSIEQEDLTDIKAELGVAPKLRSCHTAVIAGYVIEGHVPAADIRRLLSEKPKVTGLTAPGMPSSAPGMDAGKDPYDVLAFDGKGVTTVWARH